MIKTNCLSVCLIVCIGFLITKTNCVAEELIEDCVKLLSCNSIALQLIDSFDLSFNRKRFQTTSSLQLNLAENRKSLKNRKTIIIDKCRKDFITCEREIINLAKVLNVKFNFECKTTLIKEPCDLWDFFEIYLHCDARGDNQLLVDERLWMEDKCLNRTTHLNNTCHSSCKFNHTHLTPPTPCEQIKSPTQCLKSPTCGYCFDTCVESVNGAKCTEKSNLGQIGCKVKKFKDLRVEDLDIDSNCGNDKPKSIVIVPGQKKNITFSFELQKYALDFYYLMDSTFGWRPDQIKSLANLAPDLITTLQSFGTDLHVGFGAFLDKPIKPFGDGTEPYSYKNALPLTNDTSRLQEMINAIKIARYDGSYEEDVGDALVQTAECTREIGWRQGARRIILVVSDAPFHIPGKATFPSPYVHGCFLDSNGEYRNITMDFPSIQQIAAVIAKQNIRVIFAVLARDTRWYEENTKPINGAAIAKIDDVNNIIKFVKIAIGGFDSKLVLEKPPTTDTVKFRYFSTCANHDDGIGTFICEKLPKEGKVTFTVEVDLAKCPKDKIETGLDVKFNALGLPDVKELAIHYAC